MRAIQKGHLFVFLEDTEPDKTLKCIRDTNGLEGGINARLKELNRCHRGTTKEVERIIMQLYLVERSEWGIDLFLKRNFGKFPH